MIKVEELQPYAGNPRKNDVAVKAVAESIKNFGFKVPITIDKEGVIVTGHTRLRAAIKLGMKEVPVIRLDDLNEDQIKAFRLVDNKVAEIAEWDVEALIKELNEIEMDLSIFGFEKQKGINDVVDDEFEIELPKKPNAKEGDIYKLGSHRLMCGDSTDPEVIEKLMDMDMADCFITDPPYNIDYEGGANSKEKRKILNDHLSDSEFGEFLQKAFVAASFNMKPGAAFYIWHADKETINFRQACDHANLEVKQTLIWNKNAFTLGRQDYQWKHEPCLYGWKRGGTHYFIDDRTWATVIDEPLDIDKLKAKEAKDLLKKILEETQTSIIDADKPLRSAEHPTMKPIQLIAKQMLNSTRKGEAVLDTFGGSGTTLIVAEQLERRCYMCELDPKYVDVIIKRWEDFTGLTAEKLN
jgi:site-specific DNA-methyltransferase (adenine-specific)